MAEEKQEDMSMDEILSSIKNILSDGAETPIATPAENTIPETDVSVMNIDVSDTASVDLELDDTDDGILDLTADMRVSSFDVEPVVEPEHISVEDNVDIDLNNELSDISIDVPDSPRTINKDDLIIEEDISSDPIYSPEEDDMSQPLYHTTSDVVDDMPEVSPVVSDFMVETLPEEPEAYTKPDISEPTENEVDTADVSASIINNFAKIFAGSQEVKTPAPQKVSADIKLGTDLTLSDMVKLVIRDMIAENMIKNVISETDIKALVTEEASSQVKSWLNSNLPSMVEAIVKKEIERVMVKAGKN